MKKISIAILIGLCLGLVGCNVDLQSNKLNANGVTKVGNGYITGIEIDRGGTRDVVYFPSDENGNVFWPNALPSVSHNGKFQRNTGGVIPSDSQNYVDSTHSEPIVIVGHKPAPGSAEDKFVFECDNLADCKRDIATVERSIKQQSLITQDKGN